MASVKSNHGCKYAGIYIHRGGGWGGVVHSLINTAPPPPPLNKNHSQIYALENNQWKYKYDIIFMLH